MFHVQTDVCEFGDGIENYMARPNLYVGLCIAPNR